MHSEDQVGEVLLILPELSRRLRPKSPQRQSGTPLSLAQIKALIHLAQHGEEKMSELARGLDISLPAATDLVDRLAAGGHVERIRDDRDRRIVLVRLSPGARSRIEPVQAYRRRAIEKVLASLDEHERSAFIRGLHLLASSLATELMLAAGEPHDNP